MSDTHEITLNHVPIGWDLKAGNLSFLGISSVLFWLNPSLYRMLKPLVDHIGVEMFGLLVAYESSKGTEEDYHAMVTQLGETFAEGFLAWGQAVGAAGWGLFELPEIDIERRHARVRLTNPWELKMLRDTGDDWGCPFIQGKLIGIFGHAFGTTCWADAENRRREGDDLVIEYRIYADSRTIGEELNRARDAQLDARERELRHAVTTATSELEEKLTVVEQQRSLIRALSTPLIQVWDGILVLPLIGELDDERASQLTESVLHAISERSAHHLIIDVTGVAELDAEAAERLLRAIAAARLLGARCLLAGISARVAQTLVEADSDLGGVPCYTTTQDALQTILNRRGDQGGRRSRS
ncbi:MAG: STAS domain-containing protein [Nannocystaceae bacterium]